MVKTSQAIQPSKIAHRRAIERYQKLKPVDKQMITQNGVAFLSAMTNDLGKTRQVSRASIALNISALKTIQNGQALVLIETQRGLIHGVLVVRHDDSFYLFDANDSQEIDDDDYTWFSDKQYAAKGFNFIKPLRQRETDFHTLPENLDPNGGYCALVAEMLLAVLRTNYSANWEGFITYSQTVPLSQLVADYIQSDV